MKLRFHPIHPAHPGQGVHYAAAADGSAEPPAEGTAAYNIRYRVTRVRARLPIPSYDVTDPDGFPLGSDLTLRQAMTVAHANADSRAPLPHVPPLAFANLKCVNHSLAPGTPAAH